MKKVILSFINMIYAGFQEMHIANHRLINFHVQVTAARKILWYPRAQPL